MEAVDLLIERLAPRANKRSSSSTIRLTPLSTPRSRGWLTYAWVWGGDTKIRAFENLALRDDGKAIWFDDRYSYAVLAGAALNAANAEEIVTVARNLYVDIFTFDQMGCKHMLQT